MSELEQLKEYAKKEIKRYRNLIELENHTSQNCWVYKGQIKAYTKIIEQIEQVDRRRRVSPFNMGGIHK